MPNTALADTHEMNDNFMVRSEKSKSPFSFKTLSRCASFSQFLITPENLDVQDAKHANTTNSTRSGLCPILEQLSPSFVTCRVHHSSTDSPPVE